MTLLQICAFGWGYSIFRTQGFIVQAGGFGLVWILLCSVTWPLLFIADLCRILWPEKRYP